MLTRAGTARPPHVLRFRFGLWKRKVQLHVAIEWFKLVVRAQRHLVQAISRWRTVAAASLRLHGAVIAWEHTAEIRHARRPRPVRCQLSGGWAAWRMQWQEAARQRERSRRALLHYEVHRVRRQQARGWQAWLARQEEAGRCRAMLRRGVAVGARGAARRALRGWAESAQRLWLAAAERRRGEAVQQQAVQPGLHEPEWLRLAAASLLLSARATPPHTPPHTPPRGARVAAVEASDASDGLAASDADAPAPAPAFAFARGAAGGGGGGEASDRDAPPWLLQAEATLASSAAAATAAADTAAADTAAAKPLATAERAALQQSLWWWARCTANLAMAQAGRAVAHWLAKRGALRQMRGRAGWPERLTPLETSCTSQ